MPRNLRGRGSAVPAARALRLVLAAFALFVPATLNAQRPGTVAGRVLTTDAGPLVGALILLDGASAPAAQTDAQGRYRLEGLTPGLHRVEARRLGYEAESQAVRVAEGVVATADFTLAPKGVALPEVTVIGTRSDLAETRERIAQIPGAVSVVEPEVIRSSRQANLHDVLKFTPGVFVQPRFGRRTKARSPFAGRGSATTSTRGASTCSSTGCRTATPTGLPTLNRWSC